jgi:hypothetical protein
MKPRGLRAAVGEVELPPRRPKAARHSGRSRTARCRRQACLTTAAPIRQRPRDAPCVRERPLPSAERGLRGDEPRTAVAGPHSRQRDRVSRRTGAFATAARQPTNAESPNRARLGANSQKLCSAKSKPRTRVFICAGSSADAGLAAHSVAASTKAETPSRFRAMRRRMADRLARYLAVLLARLRRDQDSGKSHCELLLKQLLRVTALCSPPLVLSAYLLFRTCGDANSHRREPSSASTSCASNVGAPALRSVIDVAIS